MASNNAGVGIICFGGAGAGAAAAAAALEGGNVVDKACSVLGAAYLPRYYVLK